MQERRSTTECDADTSSRWRSVRIYLILLLLWIGACLTFTRSGFNPTDDGLIIAQAARILDGAAPHSEIVSPRPLGAALLHTLDVLLPTPLLITSRAIVLLEVLATAAISVRLLLRRKVATWGATAIGLTVIAFIGNLQTFPLMSWHTIDGILLAVTSLLFFELGVERRSRKLLAAGACIAGFAPLVKQSFFLVPVLALLSWIVLELRKRSNGEAPRWWDIALVIPLMGLPGVSYVAWVVGTSSWSATRNQILGAHGVLPWEGIRPVLSELTIPRVIFCLLLLLVFAPRRPEWQWPSPASCCWITSVARVAVGTLLVGAAAWTVWHGEFDFVGSWGASLWGLAVFGVVARLLLCRAVDLTSCLFLILAWMASLSWGYPFVNLFGGSLLVVVLVTANGLIRQVSVESFPSVPRTVSQRYASLVPVAVSLIAVGMVVVSVDARNSSTYRDLPVSAQSSDVGTISAEGWGIQTNAVTATYLGQIRDCIKKYPADRLAVLPDNAVVPVMFGKTTPFLVDWWFADELPTNRQMILDDIQRQSAKGGYLVLFQTTTVAGLSTLNGLPVAVPDSPLYDYDGGMAQVIFDALVGDTVLCGSLIGKYQPSTT